MITKQKSATKSKVLRTAATMTIHAPGKMTARGRRDVAVWLRRQADQLVRNGRDYTDGRFRAGFHYV
jgi:triphosphoribosyl-dephospho-CoA synthetase